MRRPFALLVVLVSVGLLVVWAAWPFGNDGGSPGDSAGSAPAGVETRSPAGAEGAPARPAASREPEATARPEVDLPRDPEPAAEAERGVILELVRAEEGTSCAGAWVFALDADSVECEELRTAVAAGADRREAMEQIGRFFVADEGGVAVVPAPRGDLIARALCEGLVVHRTIPAPHPGQRVRLELDAPRGLEVQVVDAAGEPAAKVPVELRAWSGRWNRGLLVRPSDAEGRVLLPEAAALVRQHAGDHDRFAVSLDLPLAEAVDVEVEPTAWPTEVIELTLPPTGSVLVRLFDEAGRPVLEPLPVNLHLDDTPDNPYAGGWNRRITGRLLYGTNARSEAGVAHFPHVGLGLHLRAAAPVLGTQDMDAGRGPGPRQPGEEITLEVHPFEDQRVISGRLVGPDGEPVGAQRLIGSFLTEARGMGFWVREGAKTNEYGEFRIGISVDLHLPATLMLQVRDADGGGGPLEARIDLPDDLPLGIAELGDLVLTPAPLLAAGTVLFGDGSAAVGASVEFAYPGRLGNNPMNMNLYELECRTDAQGRFAVHGSLPGIEKARLSVRHPGSPAVTRTFRPGEGDLEVILARSGGLVGSFLLDPSVGRRDLRLLASWETLGVTRVSTVPIEDDGRFAAVGIPEGRATLSLKMGGPFAWANEAQILWSEEVEVVAGEGRADPRIREVDLRHIRLHRVRFVDSSGQPVARTLLRDAGPRPSHWLSSEEDGVLAVPSWLGVDSWIAHARGHLDREIGAVSGDRKVVLDPALAVRFRTTGAVVSPEYRLHVDARGGEEVLMDLGASWYFDRQGRTTLYFQRPGSYAVSYRLERANGLGSVTLPADSGVLPDRIEVMAGEAQELEVILTEAALRDAMEALDGRP